MALTAGKEWTYTIAVPSYNMGTGYVTFYFQEYYDLETNVSYIYVTKIMVNHSTYKGRYYVNARITADGVAVATMSGNLWSGRITSTGTAVEVTGGALPIVGDAIAHNTDGTKAVTLTIVIDSLFSNDAGWVVNNKSGTQAVTLTTIPRASSVTCSGGDIGAAKTISISRASSAFTHTLKYSFGEASGTIVEKTASTAVNWTPPMNLCSQIPNARSGECIITCETYSGSTLIGTKTCSVTLRVPINVCLQVSEGWAKVAPYNAGTAAAGMAVYVQGYSKAQVTFDSSKISSANAYGASIASYRITYNSKNYTSPYRTDVLTQAGEITVTATVIDSRGYAVNEDFTINVEAYAKPILSKISVFRCNSLGVATNEGTYLSVTATANISDVAGLNQAVLTVAIGELMTVEVPSGQTTIVGDALVLSTLTHRVSLKLMDLLGNVAEVIQVIPTADVFFHGRQGGNGAAFGKYAEADDLLEIAWGLKTKKNLTVEGDASIDGAVNIGGELTADSLSVDGDLSSNNGMFKGRLTSNGWFYAGAGAAINYCIELNTNGVGTSHGGHIDFHYNGSTADYTSRIIEDAEGRLSFTCPNGFRINGTALTDFVVAQGESGNWSYRKWNSGLAECWGGFGYETTSNQVYNVNYAYPFAFKNIPRTVMTSGHQKYYEHWLFNFKGTATAFTGFRIQAGATTTVGGTAYVYAQGYWK